MNAKGALLMAGVTIVGFATTVVQVDLTKGAILLAIGCAVLGYREFLKGE